MQEKELPLRGEAQRKFLLSESSSTDLILYDSNLKKKKYYLGDEAPVGCVSILRYLTSKYSLPEHWYPKKDLERQARIEEYLHWQHVNTRMQCAMVFQQKLILPVARQAKIDEAKMKRFKDGIPKIVQHIDQYFLKDDKYIGGNEDVSVADLLGVAELMQLYPVFEEEFYLSNPKVKEWMERVRERLNPHFDEGHSIVYRTREAYKKIGPQLGAKL